MAQPEDEEKWIYFSYSKPYFYSSLLTQLSWVKKELMKNKDKDNDKVQIPRMMTVKVIKMEQEPTNIDKEVKKIKNPVRGGSRKRMSNFDMKRHQIKQSTMRQILENKNQFEIEQSKNKINDLHAQIRNNGDDDEDSFEITNSYLLFKQTVLSHSLGGQAIF
jgi:hypothetical protein